MHSISVQEFLITAEADGTPTFSGRVILRVRTGFRQACRANQTAAELTKHTV